MTAQELRASLTDAEFSACVLAALKSDGKVSLVQAMKNAVEAKRGI